MPDSQDWLEAYEPAPAITGGELLRRAGFEAAPPAAVDDVQLRGRLWELIYTLAARRIFLRATNHLSNRALYVWLHDEWLSETAVDVPPEAGWNGSLQPAGVSASPEAAAIFLRFYADERERARWSERHPGHPLPSREPHPFDRDRFLPAAPEPLGEAEGSDLPELNSLEH